MRGDPDLEQRLERLQRCCDRLLRESNSVSVFLVGNGGDEIVRAGTGESLDPDLQRTLMGAADGDTGAAFQASVKTHSLCTRLGDRAYLIVLFDGRSSLGLVRLRVKKIGEEILRELGPPDPGSAPPVGETGGSSGSPASAQLPAEKTRN